MGGKGSKQLERGGSVRQSQTNRFKLIKMIHNKLSKQLANLKEEHLTEEQAKEYFDQLQELQEKLQAISPNLKDKHKPLFDEYVTKCQSLKETIESKVKVEDIVEEQPPADTRSVELNVVQLVVEEKPPEEPPNNEVVEVADSTLEKKKKLRKRKGDTYKRKFSAEEASFEAIHKIRERMEEIRDEVLVFKGVKEDQVYHYLKESLIRLIKKLQLIETYDQRQIKYERKVAIDHAQDSIQALEQIASGMSLSEVRKSLVNEDEDDEECDAVRENSEPEVDMRDFREKLNAKLMRQTIGDHITVNMIRKLSQNEEIRKSAVYTTDEDFTSDGSLDVDDVLHPADSVDNLAMKVTSI